MRTLIASLVCAAALLVAAIPASASPIGGRPQAPAVEQASGQPVIHELHTVVRERDAGRTLSLVLAAAALVVATASAVYGRSVVVRTSRAA